MNRFVAIGEIVKAIGLKGEVKLYPLLDFFDPLLDSPYLVWADGTPAAIIRHRPAGSCIALQASGATDRSGAEALVGKELGFMSESYLDPAFPRPEEGLPFRWLGREVVTVDGRSVGVVDEVRLAGHQFLLVIPAADGEILVPAVEPILRPDPSLDAALVIDPPEGLLDVHRN